MSTILASGLAQKGGGPKGGCVVKGLLAIAAGAASLTSLALGTGFGAVASFPWPDMVGSFPWPDLVGSFPWPDLVHGLGV